MQLPLIFLDAAAIEEVPLGLWRETFEALGWPASLRDDPSNFTYADLQDALRKDDLTDNLLHALEILHTLGTDAGREAITSIMSERKIQRHLVPNGASERELAIRLYLAQRTDAAMADVFARVQTQVQEAGDRRRYSEFLAREPRPVRNLKGHRTALTAAVRRHCRDSDLGDHVQVEAFEDEGVCIFSILRSDRMKKPLAVVPGHSARAVLPFRPVHGDILRYEDSLGRLRVAARARSMVEFYRATLGRVLFGDEDFFRGDAVCSLAVLQQQQRAALADHGVFGISQVRLTEVVWECGDGSYLTLRDRDCFNLIERHHLSLAGGTFVQAKLKVDVIGKSTRPVIVTVQVPSRIEVSQKKHECLMDELLDAIGIRIAAAEANRLDLWSLYPWHHPISIWRELFGGTTDALVKERVLRRVQLQAVEHPDHPNAGRVLRVEQISEFDFQGVSIVPEVPSRSLSATDVEGLELAPELFRQYLRNALGISEGGEIWNDGDELLHLGWMPVGEGHLHVAYAIRQPPRPDVGPHLRTLNHGAPVVLLMPATQQDMPGVATVMLSRLIPSRHQVVRDGAAACGIADQLPAILLAPDNAELVVDMRLRKVWICGEEAQELRPDSHQFQFVEMLAKSNGAPVSFDVITRTLSAARFLNDDTTTARQAKLRAKKSIMRALQTASAADTSDPFPSAGTGFYRCRLRSFVR